MKLGAQHLPLYRSGRSVLDSNLYQTTRRADGRWDRYESVSNQAGNNGDPEFFGSRIACANVNGELHAVIGKNLIIPSDHALWHTVRHLQPDSNGNNWVPFDNVIEGGAGFTISANDISKIACASVRDLDNVDNLQLLVAVNDRILSTIRLPQGDQFGNHGSGFEDVTRQTGTKGTIVGLACAAIASPNLPPGEDLHVIISNGSALFHTIGHPGGSPDGSLSKK